MEKKPDLLQGIENRADWILKRFELQVELADYNKRMLREYMVFQFTEYVTDIAKQFQSQLSQVNKYNDQLICAAHDSELKAKESQSQNKRLLSALKEWKKLKYSSNGTDWYNFEIKVEQLINDSGER